MRLMKLTNTFDETIFVNPLEVVYISDEPILDNDENVVGYRTRIELANQRLKVKETKEQVAEEWEACTIQNCDCRDSRQY